MTRENKKIEILKAAGSIFSKKGFHGAKMEDIAKTAGIGKGTVYGYFESKEVLFYELIRYGMEEYKNGMGKAFMGKGLVRDKIIRLCRYHGEFLIKYTDIAQIVINQQETLKVEFKQEIIREKISLYHMMEDVLREGQASGEIRNDLDVELGTLVIVGAISQFYGKRIFYDKVKYSDISPEAMVEILFQGL